MNKRSFIASFIMLISWALLAQVVQNDILLPDPIQVLKIMSNQVTQLQFYQHMIATISITLTALMIAVGLALILGIWCGLSPKVYQWVSPGLTLIKTIPNISFIIFLLIWLSNQSSLITIVVLIIFPILFESVMSNILAIDQDQKDVLRLYSDTPINLLKVVYLPSIYLPFISTCKSCITLGLKVTVMAELIGQAKLGIGSMMAFERLLLNMDSLFAWTIWIIGIGLLFDQLLSRHAAYVKHRLEN